MIRSCNQHPYARCNRTLASPSATPTGGRRRTSSPSAEAGHRVERLAHVTSDEVLYSAPPRFSTVYLSKGPAEGG